MTTTPNSMWSTGRRSGQRVLLLLVVLAIGLAALPAGAAEAAVDEFIVDEMSAAGVPGLAHAVVADGEVTTIGAHGVTGPGGERVAAETPFQIGSISKSFTALAVMQLVEAGEVGLDTEISEYLEDFSEQSGAITVRQLLSHTSGFSTLQGNTSFTDPIGGNDELARQVEGLAEADPAHRPGQRWEYSNANYQVLGRLVEVVSGQDYQSYVTDHILEPVGMEHSFVADGEVHEEMATGHRPWFGTKRPLGGEQTTDRGTAPQGGIIASAGDMALYLQMMMDGQDDVLSAEGKAQMVRPAGAASPNYGFGWYVDPATSEVWHSGLTPGFEAFATMNPATGDAAVVLLNANGGLGFGETADLQNGVIALSLGRDHESGGSAWPRASLFGSLLVAPVFYVIAIVWAWRKRDVLRAKGGAAGLFSLWFPVLTTGVAAWVLLSLVPRLFGTSLRSLALFQPDLVLLMIASGGLGVLWTVFRLGVAHSGRATSE